MGLLLSVLPLIDYLLVNVAESLVKMRMELSVDPVFHCMLLTATVPTK
jgi:hypothetical protein